MDGINVSLTVLENTEKLQNTMDDTNVYETDLGNTEIMAT